MGERDSDQCLNFGAISKFCQTCYKVKKKLMHPERDLGKLQMAVAKILSFGPTRHDALVIVIGNS